MEDYNDVAADFRSTAEGETGHAHGHLEYLETCGDPATGLPFSVHFFLRFELTREVQQALKSGAALGMGIDDPEYTCALLIM